MGVLCLISAWGAERTGVSHIYIPVFATRARRERDAQVTGPRLRTRDRFAQWLAHEDFVETLEGASVDTSIRAKLRSEDSNPAPARALGLEKKKCWGIFLAVLPTIGKGMVGP